MIDIRIVDGVGGGGGGREALFTWVPIKSMKQSKEKGEKGALACYDTIIFIKLFVIDMFLWVIFSGLRMLSFDT